MAASRLFQSCFPVQVPSRYSSHFSLLSVFSFFLRSCNMATDESSAPRAYSMRGYERFWFQNRLSGFRGRSVEAVQKWTREIYVLARCVPSFFVLIFYFLFSAVYRCREQQATARVCRIIYSRATLLHYLNISCMWRMGWISTGCSEITIFMTLRSRSKGLVWMAVTLHYVVQPNVRTIGNFMLIDEK